MKQYIVKVYTDRTEWYNERDQLHREDGPAVESSNGSKQWFINGKFHREDGPAVEWFDGTKSWYINDKLHREDGPAVERANGTKCWYINDEQLTEQEFNHQKNPCEGKIVDVDGKKYKLVSI